MSTHTEQEFSGERGDVIRSIETIASGRGWCNVVPGVVEDVGDLKVSTFGLGIGQGAPVASFVTSAPRHGEAQPSSLGVLHTRGRLGIERITLLLGGAPFTLRQDHSQRGVLLEVPADAPAAQVLYVMCSMTESLCTFEMNGRFRFDLYLR